MDTGVAEANDGHLQARVRSESAELSVAAIVWHPVGEEEEARVQRAAVVGVRRSRIEQVEPRLQAGAEAGAPAMRSAANVPTTASAFRAMEPLVPRTTTPFASRTSTGVLCR